MSGLIRHAIQILLLSVLSVMGNEDRGRELALQRCQACHVFPEPDLLPKYIWKHYVLPEMGYRFGIKSDPAVDRAHGKRFTYRDKVAEQRILDSGFYPQTPTISVADWKTIESWYLENAPEDLALIPESSRVFVGLDQFSVLNPGRFGEHLLTSLVEIDEKDHRIVMADAQSMRLSLVNGRSGELFFGNIGGAAVDVHHREDGRMDVLQIGELFPGDRHLGRILRMTWNSAETNFTQKVLLDGLARPSSMVFADMNQDGREDIVIAEFGFRLGYLTWYEGLEEGGYEKHVLSDRAGTVKVAVRDMNSDGRPDILALAGQGREGLSIYYNRGEERFEEDYVIPYPPTHGSADFKLVDFDKDGDLDVAIATGDTGDYIGATLLKHYQGLRLYLNDGENQFEEVYSYPMYGAYGVEIEDFDEDGDYDIAVISFFADYRSPGQRSFVYLENLGKHSFLASTFNQAGYGRWLRIHAGDFDGDGDKDLVLGSFTPGPSAVPKQLQAFWAKQGAPMWILLNRLKNSK